MSFIAAADEFERDPGVYAQKKPASFEAGFHIQELRRLFDV